MQGPLLEADMRLDDLRTSDNVEDRRGDGGFSGGGGTGFGIGGGRLGIGTVVVLGLSAGRWASTRPS